MYQRRSLPSQQLISNKELMLILSSLNFDGLLRFHALQISMGSHITLIKLLLTLVPCLNISLKLLHMHVGGKIFKKNFRLFRIIIHGTSFHVLIE